MRLQRRGLQVFEFARLRIAGLTLDEIQSYGSQYDFVTPSLIRDAARKYFDLSRIATGVIQSSEENRGTTK
jgi:hypothetical protein